MGAWLFEFHPLIVGFRVSTSGQIRGETEAYSIRFLVLPSGAFTRFFLLPTAPCGRRYFVILSLYSATEPAIAKSWKPRDIEKIKMSRRCEQLQRGRL
jgi:hypothetical protein